MRGSEGAVRKVPTEATRWRPTLLLVRFGKGFIETYSLRGEQGAMSLLHPALRSALRSGSPRVVVMASGMTGDQDEWGGSVPQTFLPHQGWAEWGNSCEPGCAATSPPCPVSTNAPQ
jgi:hypothetical protein